jgi:two-component system chemotaxis sensor kinase CheA
MQDNSSDPKRTNSFKAIIYFQEGCEMENVRAFGVIHNLEDIASEIRHVPEDVMIPEAAEVIRQEGLTIYFRTECSYVDVHQLLMQTIFLKELELEQISDNNDIRTVEEDRPTAYSDHNTDRNNTKQQSIISVPVVKLDKLMDLMGEFVIAEAMVTQNTDLKGLILENFQKAARQLHKITNEIQDVIMSIRMVPLSATFQKMNRIVRDMCKKLEKEAQLRIIGDETEADKNVIECISDPLIHLVRNALDHGIEHPGQRTAADKPRAGTITLEAKNSGNDVLIIVRDDGKGLDRDKILKKAKDLGLLNKPPEELVDREVYNLIFAPGLSIDRG